MQVFTSWNLLGSRRALRNGLLASMLALIGCHAPEELPKSPPPQTAQNGLMQHAHTRLVHEFNTSSSGRYVQALTTFRDRALMSVYSDGDGNLWWITDGTDAGTYCLSPSPASGFTPSVAAVAGESALLNASGNLLETDGTIEGTRLLQYNGAPVNTTTRVATDGRKYYFLVYSTLWESDGTSTGTHPVVTITAPGHPATDSPVWAADRLFFFRDSALWVSDLTEAGTQLVRSFDQISSVPAAALANTIVFAAASAKTGLELWVSDGTQDGTRLLKDFTPGPDGSSPQDFLRLGSRVVFNVTVSGKFELWSTDGTAAGTVRLGGGARAVELNTPPLIGHGDRAYYFADVLWETDGTPAGTRVLYWPPYGGALVSAIRPCGARVFFLLDYIGNPAGREPWVTDSSSAGAHMLLETQPGIYGAYVRSTACIGDKFLFSDESGGGLWISDGTSQGTTIFRSFSTSEGGDPRFATEVGGAVILQARADQRWVPWRTDGTTAGTEWLLDPATTLGLVSTEPFGRVRGGLVFPVADYSLPYYLPSLWFTDGTRQGTHSVAPVQAPSSFTEMDGGRSIFIARDSTGRDKLWATDGTDAGTELLSPDEVYGPTNKRLPGYGEGALYIATNVDTGAELHFSDGTIAGTRLFLDSSLGPSSGIAYYPGTLGRTVFFMSAPWNSQLWKTEGNFVSTTPLGVNSSGIFDFLFTPVGDRLWFRTAQGQFGTRSVWTVDQDGGTQLVRTGFGEVQQIVAKTAGVYFLADNRLWQSDGTDAGTYRVTELTVLNEPGSVLILEPEGRVVFAASDGLWGSELWTSDGTPGRERRITDVAPGGLNAWPKRLFRRGSEIWFSATDGFSGEELWSVSMDLVLDDEAPAVSCPADIDAELTEPGGARVTYQPTGTDNLTSAPYVFSRPPSGSLIPVGDTLVTSTARDEAGNESSCQFHIRVIDSTPPDLVCEPAVFVELPSNVQAAFVALPYSVSDLSGNAQVSLSHDAGTPFFMGTTRVAITASDDAGNSSSCAIDVTVQHLGLKKTSSPDASSTASPDASFENPAQERANEILGPVGCGCLSSSHNVSSAAMLALLLFATQCARSLTRRSKQRRAPQITAP